MEKINAAIVGGGPAGLQAAISLSRAGIEPTIFEEHSEIGIPIQCGEGLSIHAFNDFAIPTETRNLWLDLHKRCKIFFPGNSIIYGDIQAYMIRRDKFDQYLAEKARSLGSEIHTSTKVQSLERSSEGIKLKVQGEEQKMFQSNLVILAEGAKAKLAKSIGFSPPSPLIYAFEFKVDGSWSEEIEFHFDSVKYPSGYAWVFPRKNETNVGIVTTAKERVKRLESFMKQKGISGKILKKVGGPIPMEGPIQRLYQDNMMVVGDAGGMINPIFYGGIRIGMMSGDIAGKIGAQYLSNMYENKTYSLTNYQHEISKYKFMNKINLKCHRFFYSRSNTYLSRLGKLLNNQYINRIEGREITKVLLKLMKETRLLKHPLGLFQIYKGFKIARDWGF